MIKKILKAIKNIKVVNRFFISYSVLVFVVINSWIFSYSTTKQLETNLHELNGDVLQAFFIVNDLKNEVNDNVLACYDYLATNNSVSLNNYYTSLEKIKTQSDNAFTQVQSNDYFNVLTLQQKIDRINELTGEIITLYQTEPAKADLPNKISALKVEWDNFNQQIKSEVDLSLQSEVSKSQTIISEKIEQVTTYLITVVVFIVIVTVLLIVFMHYNITTPVNTIKDAAIKFGQGKLVKIDMDSKDELGILSNAFNKMVEDITATQRNLQEELAKTKEIDNQKSEFLSIAAHQLRTPMSGLKWLLNLALSGDLGPINEKQQHLLRGGLENIDRMIKLINDFLDIAKIEQAKFQYKLEKVQLSKIIDEAVSMMEAKMKNKQIILKIDQALEPPEIFVDKEKMKIVFINLIDNAIKYSPAKSTITILLSANATNVMANIADQGYGIPTQDQKLIFTKFFRSPNILKKETSLDSIGTGLGLYIVKDIIIKHNGTITFTSTENKGTTFYIKLPIVNK